VKTGKLYAPENAAPSLTFVHKNCEAVALDAIEVAALDEICGSVAVLFPPALQALTETQKNKASDSAARFCFEIIMAASFQISNVNQMNLCF
jgi:hypothetical protein